jgi:chlorobactene glucosyltransferase
MDYPDFEIIVVDDRSDDGTAGLARTVRSGNAARIEVVAGAELPDGWLGKPWACAQGASRSRGELVLFTDADTTHGPELLGKAVQAMQEDGADLLTLLGRQLMETFWERVVQTQVFLAMFLRYPDFERTVRDGHWRDAIANGQYMMFRRAGYEEIGGHEAVRGSVVEDQALAQLMKRRGKVISVRSAKDDFATRMYRSLEDVIEGWTKNIVNGGRASLPPRVQPLMAPAALVGGVGLWIVPPTGFLLALGGVGLPGLLTWSALAVLWSCLLWMRFTHQMQVPALYGLAYPAGAAVAMYIVAKAWMRGSRVAWKGREYRVESPGVDE